MDCPLKRVAVVERFKQVGVWTVRQKNGRSKEVVIVER